MSAWVDSIATHLVTAGVATPAWPVHKLGAQDLPEQSITIYESGGPMPEQSVDRRWRRPTFQIVARGGRGDSQAASDKAHEICVTLDRAAVSGFDYFFAMQSAPVSIGPDEEGRPLFAVNFRAGES